MPPHTRTVRSHMVAGGCAMLAAVATLGTAAGPALAATSSSTLGCEPIACAATYIGVPTRTLAADIATQTRRTGTLGIHVAIDQLDAALAAQLSAIVPGTDESLVMSHYTAITRHHAIHNALLDQAVTGLRGALGG